MRPADFQYAKATRRYVISGGTVIRVPKTPAESLALYLRLRKLKADFLRRQEAR